MSCHTHRTISSARILLTTAVFIACIILVNGVLDDPCTADSDCTSVANAICTDATCRCNHDTGHGADKSNTACDQVCGTDQLYCTNGNCVDQTVRDNGINDCGDNTDEGPYRYCPKKFVLKFNDYLNQTKCTDGTTCTIIDFMNDGTAECPDLSDEKKTLGTQCNYKFQQYDPFTCTYWMDDSECVDDGTGVWGTCQCRSGAYNQDDNLGCIVRVLGDSCSVEPDCEDAVTDSECAGGICACDIGHKAVGNASCPWRELGDACSVDADCSASISDSNCTNSQCMCDSGYIQDGVRTCRLRKITDPCTSDSDCTMAVANSQCTGSPSTCQCTSAYVSNGDGTKCEEKQVGDTCEADSECGFADNAECIEGVCDCPTGYYDDGSGNCVPVQIGTGGCESDADCLMFYTNSHCNGGLCDCVSGYIFENPECVQMELGDTCSSNSDCDQAIANSQCAGGKCICDEFYSQPEDASHCQRIPIDEIRCTEDQDCLDGSLNSECGEDGSCNCLAGYNVHYTGTCVANEIGNECVEPTDCTDHIANSVCSAGKCACASGFVSNSAGDECIGFEAGTTPCGSTSDCLSGSSNAVCKAGKCVCADGYQTAVDLSKCYQPIAEVTPCSYVTSCNAVLNHTRCIDGVCMCLDGYYVIGSSNQCELPTLGGACETNSTCYVVYSTCTAGVCTCIVGYEQEGDYTCAQADQIVDNDGCSGFFGCYPWAIAIIILAVLVLIAIILLIVFIKKKKKKKTQDEAPKRYKLRMPDILKTIPTNHVMYESEKTKEPKDIDMYSSDSGCDMSMNSRTDFRTGTAMSMRSDGDILMYMAPPSVMYKDPRLMPPLDEGLDDPLPEKMLVRTHSILQGGMPLDSLAKVDY